MATSKHHLNGGASPHCDNNKLEEAINRYQTKGDVGSLGEIIKLTQDRALTLMRFYKTTRYQREDELLSDVNFKLLKAVGSFNPERGHTFSFLSHVVTNALRTSVTNARRKTKQYVKLDKPAASKLVTNGETESEDAIADQMTSTPLRVPDSHQRQHRPVLVRLILAIPAAPAYTPAAPSTPVHGSVLVRLRRCEPFGG